MHKEPLPTSLEAIAQKHDMSSALACVAFVTGKTYDEVAQDEPPEKLNQSGYWAYEIVEKLHSLGRHYNYRQTKPGEASFAEAGGVCYL